MQSAAAGSRAWTAAVVNLPPVMLRQVSDPSALQAKLQDENTLSSLQNALNQNGVCKTAPRLWCAAQTLVAGRSFGTFANRQCETSRESKTDSLHLQASVPTASQLATSRTAASQSPGRAAVAAAAGSQGARSPASPSARLLACCSYVSPLSLKRQPTRPTACLQPQCLRSY